MFHFRFRHGLRAHHCRSKVITKARVLTNSSEQIKVDLGIVFVPPVSLHSLQDWHVIEVEVTGPAQPDGRTFTAKTTRKNPADPGAVTGSATFGSFFSSLLNAARRHGYHPETGFILC